MIRSVVALIAVAALTGCARTPVRPQVASSAPIAAPAATPLPGRAYLVVTATTKCPTAADIRRIRAARPKPLRQQTMPASPAERVARTAAQLGQYEARGAWADQVEDMLARCTDN